MASILRRTRGLTRRWQAGLFAALATALATALAVPGTAAPGAATRAATPESFEAPGVVIDHSPASTGIYIGSPSLAILTNGDYVASHDEFGPKSTEHTRAISHVFRSQDRGKRWNRISTIDGAFWSTLFVHRGALYLIGPDKHHGNVLIRRSLDGGATWTTPTNRVTGLLRDDGQYHCAPMPVIEHEGRLWRAMEWRNPPVAWGINYRAGMMSVPVDADLLDAAGWTFSNFVPSDRAWNGGDMGAWLEGNAVVTPAGDLVDVLRVQTKSPDEKAAIVPISPDGKSASFDPVTGFISFPGGAKKFTIRFDPRTKRYWSLASIVRESHRADDPGKIRNTLALTTSPDLLNWEVRCILLYHPEVKRHGFQYVDWLFDGEDIIAACRTAFDDGEGGAHNNHDANFLTFHRFANFRRLTMADSVPAGAAGSSFASATSAHSVEASTTNAPQVIVLEGGESKARPEDCRAILVGPGINQPDPFPGYRGFVGWESPVRLKNGDWLVGFNAGYWHASPPTPLRYPAKTLAEYQKLGLPAEVVAPTGGRAMIIRSTDQGKTWSKPETLIDTPADDRHPAFIELQDDTVLCSFFTYMGEPEGGVWKDPSLTTRVLFTRSFDGGRTWEKKPNVLQTPFTYDETDGPLVKLKDGSLVVAINGRPRSGPPDEAAVLRSTNGGLAWTMLGTVHAAHDLQEVTVAELPSGEWVMMARAEGDICWSRDRGRTWTVPVTFGMRMYAPSLYVLRDGTLLCLHGSYGAGGLRVIFSTDGGHTWAAAGKNHGFLVDNSYGYGKGMELPDGSLFIVYLATGGHQTSDAQSNAIRCIRLRVRPDHSGIDLLPAPNR
jgi:photosystem II stability/assembly factor-like uncharacterized protein